MDLLQELERTQVGHLSLDEHVTVDETATVADVVRQMRHQDRTTALVTRDGKLAGIFTERDALRKIGGRPEALSRPVRELMTPEPVAVAPEAVVVEALRKMRDGGFRDLPVVDGAGAIVGNLTDNAVVRYIGDCLQEVVLNLPPDPDQVPKSVEGA